MSQSEVPVAIALGSNVGNRGAHLDWAINQLREVVDGLMASDYIETAPVGVAPQHDFLNGVVIGRTTLTPRALLERLMAIEAERGRVRTEPGQPRVLDLDLILYGEITIDEPDFTVPHPRFRERTFVLDPLATIAPGWRDPKTDKTIAGLCEALRNEE